MLLALTVAVLGVSFLPGIVPTVAGQPADADGGYVFPIQIDAVRVQVIPGERNEVVAHVDGVVGNGCTRFERVQQERDGDVIYLWVLGHHSGAEVCSMLALLFRQPISLNGDFPPGTYQLVVNGTPYAFQVT